MSNAIAISGMACRFPDADSPIELWRNVLSQRRAFRRIPRERLSLDDYLAADTDAGDRTYSEMAAVLDGWQFDRVRFRIAGSTYRSTDLAQWLALDVASEALQDAGLDGDPGLERERVGVLVGNTLTGEFSRARVLRLRWPYVRRTVAATLADENVPLDDLESFLGRLEERFKEPFAPIDEDALAGALSNTIAGRICNAFDLNGGGFTIDGACASSLLAVANACAALSAGDLDIALAGGVDLSLDPFELVGFAKAGALARTAMRVYDQRPQGFWPGEGCGFVVLERLDGVRARGGRPYAVISGWGVSSDGAGGITRPTVDGELTALRRAYARAGVGIDTVDLFEGHGTGTEVGDRTELTALDMARRADGANRAAPVGSVKANIGHTKAAAGAAGLIKATLSVYERVIPPTTGCERPHELLRGSSRTLRAASEAEGWPHGRRGRAGVSGFGFGGINCHLVVEGLTGQRRRLGRHERRLSRSAQDAELIVLGAPDDRAMAAQVTRLGAIARHLSLAELGDLANALRNDLPADEESRVRAALVVATPNELADGLHRLATVVEQADVVCDTHRSVFLGRGSVSARRVGLLFPGQAAPTYHTAGALGRRFSFAERLAARLLPAGDEELDTAIAQPAIVGCELIGLELLRGLGVTARVAVGHSVGELAALHWAAVMSGEQVMALARARGVAIAQHGASGGAMAGLATSPADAQEVIAGEPSIVVAAENGPAQVVISGPTADVERVVERAAKAGVVARRLAVSHAFHSPLVADAAPALASCLAELSFASPRRTVISTVTGERLGEDDDIRRLLIDQLTRPVRFGTAVRRACEETDLLLEVGPGTILTHLAHALTSVPVLPLDIGGPSLRPVLAATAAMFASGMPLRLDVLFTDRFTRPFDPDRRRAFLANPCEPPPADAGEASPNTAALPAIDAPAVTTGDSTRAIDLLRRMVARRAELPESAVQPGSRLLEQLHLTSIAVGELAAQAAHELGSPAPALPTELADATVADLAAALEAAETAGPGGAPVGPEGVADWFHTFVPQLITRSPAAVRPSPSPCRWRVIAPHDHPMRVDIAAAFAADDGGPAILVCLPPDPREEHAALMLRAAREQREHGARRCAFLQTGGGAAGFAKSLHLERPDVDVAVIDMPLHPALLPQARREAETVLGFREVVLDRDGGRRVPVLRPMSFAPISSPIASESVILVTGGGKGIGAECALALARASGARVALMGRSRPDDDTELRENLMRFDDRGIRWRYDVADVTDRRGVERVVRTVREDFGEVTAILHAAGRNRPARIDDLDAAELARTLRPKVNGLQHLLAAIDRDRLRLLVTFGSIIGRIGLRGEAHYALANEWLSDALAKAREKLPRCRCVNFEWTAWSGAGMAERLGTVAALAQTGVTPLPLDEGIRQLERLVSCDLPPSVLVTGRFGPPPTVELERRELPLLRFLERPRVHYPTVEMVVEAELSAGSDPYLSDHMLDGTMLFPAVVGLEAMASVAAALRPLADVPVLTDARFDRPVTVPSDRSRVIQIACLAQGADTVKVRVRSEESGFRIDHFSVTCRFGSRHAPEAGPPRTLARDSVALEPRRDLYGGLLFQGRRFQRVVRYRSLHGQTCVAEVVSDSADWYGPFHSQTLLLGDPGAHDAVIHAIQPCIPHARLVPVGLERLVIYGPLTGDVVVAARERASDGTTTFLYDVEVTDTRGRLVERWDGLALRRIGDITPRTSWPPALLVPYLERRLAEETGAQTARIGLRARGGARRASSDHAIGQALGEPVTVRRRADGRPEVVESIGVSTAHLDGYTLALTGHEPLGCDVEALVQRPLHIWLDLLGERRLELARVIASETGTGFDAAATRTWAAVECLKKAGLPVTEPLMLASTGHDGWIVLRAGAALITTWVTRLDATEDSVAIALLAGASMS